MLKKLKNNLTNLFKNKILRTLFIYVLFFFVIVSIIFTVNKINPIIATKSTLTLAPKYTSNTSIKIRINEYVTSNNNTFRDNDFGSPDWIELYNFGDEPIWLGDIYLSDNMEEPDKFLLSDITLMPNEYLLILATDEMDKDDGYLRASFKLGKDDKHILLFKNQQTLDIINIEYLPTDISIGYDQNNKLGYFKQPTPGFANNTQEYNSHDITPINEYKNIIIINEYITNNQHNITDHNGEHHDWIELYNPSKNPVFLGDMYLSDDEGQLNKFKLPNIELQGNSYLIIYASAKKSNVEDQIYAPFKIGANDTKLILSHKYGHVINSCAIYDLPVDVSYGINENGEYGFFNIPTPSKENTTTISKSIDISANYIPSSPIIINEWMSNNEFSILDADGDTSDWLELYNPSTQTISLDGYALTDNKDNLFKWIFPENIVIEPNSYLLIFASEKDHVIDGEIHTNFALGDDETLYLIESNASIVDSVEIQYLAGNVSKGRVEDGYGYFTIPTPNKANTGSYTTKVDDNVSFVLSDIYISEVCSSSIDYTRYSKSSLCEYIELYNQSNTAINLLGYSISETSLDSYIFDDIIIDPKQYMLLTIKGRESDDPDNILVTNLSLNSAGERILLKNNNGVIIDRFDTGYLLGDYSSGRIIGDENKRVFFIEKTPQKVNSTNVYTSYCDKPSYSHQGGMIEKNILLSISANDNATIYYTLDGDIPDSNSKIYTESIPIDKDTIVRSIAISQGKLPSPITSTTYLLERQHDIPIVCLASPHGGLFGYSQGIYADGPGHDIGIYPYFESNYFRNVERPVSFEYYKDNELGLAFEAGIQIAGGYTRAVPQKSLVIRLRDEYGLSEVKYPFFDEGVDIFRHILLRNAGQDGYKTKIRDSFTQNTVAELGTVDMKRGRPVAVYINAQYWGLYNLRDKLNDDHLAIKYDIDQDDVDIISEYSYAKSGSNVEWQEFQNFCNTTNFRISENYDKFAENVDIQSFIDYIIVETFYGNVDTHNINFWKADINGAKWKPLLFDMDLSLRGVDYSLIEGYLGSYDLGFHSHIIRIIKKNSDFEKLFIERYSYILNNIFTQEYLEKEIDLLYNEIDNEMIYHLKRWNRPRSMEYWQTSMDVFKTRVLKRRYDVVEELEDFFDLDESTIIELFPWYT